MECALAAQQEENKRPFLHAPATQTPVQLSRAGNEKKIFVCIKQTLHSMHGTRNVCVCVCVLAAHGHDRTHTHTQPHPPEKLILKRRNSPLLAFNLSFSFRAWAQQKKAFSFFCLSPCVWLQREIFSYIIFGSCKNAENKYSKWIASAWIWMLLISRQERQNGSINTASFRCRQRHRTANGIPNEWEKNRLRNTQ